MTKKFEIYRFGSNGIPEGLARKLVIPEHINPDEHPLKSYIHQDLITSDLDLVLLEDLNGFYQILTENPFGFLSSCRGLYIAKDHAWISHEHYEKTCKVLKDEYGLNIQRALLLPQERVDYWTMIHEALHDVFYHIPQEQRERIIKYLEKIKADCESLELEVDRKFKQD